MNDSNLIRSNPGSNLPVRSRRFPLFLERISSFMKNKIQGSRKNFVENVLILKTEAQNEIIFQLIKVMVHGKVPNTSSCRVNDNARQILSRPFVTATHFLGGNRS